MVRLEPTLLMLTMAALLLAQGCRCNQHEPLPQDIILISLDAVRADRGPGPRGPGVMPHYAKFAAEGVRFAEAWAPASNTLVSHASLFTGKYPWEHSFDPGSSPPPEPPDLMPALKRAGYHVAVFTSMKFWLGPKYRFDAGADVFRTGMVPGSVVLSWVREWLETDPPHPRALFVHLYDAHSDKWRPYDAPDLSEAAKAFDGCVGDLCGTQLLLAVSEGRAALPPEAPAAIEAAYSDACREVDGLLGRLLEMLAASSRDRFVAVFADHGELLGEDGWLHHGGHPAVLDIPLAVQWTGGQRGVVTHTPVSLVDLYWTVMSIAGIVDAPDRDLRNRIDAAPSLPVVSASAARWCDRAVSRVRDGRLEGFTRAEGGGWQGAAVDPALARLLDNPGMDLGQWRLEAEKCNIGSPDIGD